MMRRKHQIWLGALVLAAACSDAGTGPNPANVAGTYVASGTRGEFLYTEDGKTWDLAQEGSSIELFLYQNGTTAGRIFVPGESNGPDYDASLAGQWVVRNDTVFVIQAVATIISAMGLAVDGDALRGEQQFGTAHIRVRLVR